MRILAVTLLVSVLAGAALAGEEKDTSADLAEKLRAGEPLSVEEQRYIDRLTSARGWTRRQAADHLERVWLESERLERERASALRRGAAAPGDGAPSRTRGLVPWIVVGCGILLFALERLLSRLWRWRRERIRLARVRDNGGATELAVMLSARPDRQAAAPDPPGNERRGQPEPPPPSGPTGREG